MTRITNREVASRSFRRGIATGSPRASPLALHEIAGLGPAQTEMKMALQSKLLLAHPRLAQKKYANEKNLDNFCGRTPYFFQIAPKITVSHAVVARGPTSRRVRRRRSLKA
jgi:hypothetical protein